MKQLIIHHIYKPIKKYLPSWISKPIRNILTGVLTPIWYSYRTGHFLSSLRAISVTKNGTPIPWYTYPCIEFLNARFYENKRILEFGGGQSTLWWSSRANHLVTFESDRNWYLMLKQKIQNNVDLYHIPELYPSICIEEIYKTLNKEYMNTKFDIIIIDGLFRRDLVKVAIELLSEDGAIICDNAEGYGFYDEFKKTSFKRIDFFGNAPGIILPHCTSIFFNRNTFLIDSVYPFPEEYIC